MACEEKKRKAISSGIYRANSYLHYRYLSLLYL